MQISVIIPIYKVEKYIERCLLSVINQSIQGLECVLVNDASPDNSKTIVGQVLSEYHGNISFQWIENERNQGVAFTRNKGIEAATGDYLYFLDADDELLPMSLQVLFDAAERNQADMVLGEVQVLGLSKSPFARMPLKKETHFSGQAVLSSFLQKQWYDMACNKLIKRTIFNDWPQAFPQGIIHGEDSLFSFRLAHKIRSLVIVSDITYLYYIHSESITRQKSKKNIDSIYSVIQAMVEESHRQKILETPELLPFLEGQRIYFIKSLLRGRFPKSFIRAQKEKINELYRNQVWVKGKRKAEFIFKDFVLTILQLFSPFFVK